MNTLKNFFWALLFAGIGFSALMIFLEVSWWAPKVNIPKVTGVLNLSNFSLVNAPKESLRGTITSMTGEVKWESRIATEAAKITVPITVQQGESLSTGEAGTLSLLFDKNLQIDFSPKTEIGIIQTLPADLVFFQKSGTADYKKLSTTPVSIRALHLLIENGGQVMISVDGEVGVVTLNVVSGTSTVAYNDINNISRVLEVDAGKKLIFNDDTRRAVVK